MKKLPIVALLLIAGVASRVEASQQDELQEGNSLTVLYNGLNYSRHCIADFGNDRAGTEKVSFLRGGDANRPWVEVFCHGVGTGLCIRLKKFIDGEIIEASASMNWKPVPFLVEDEQFLLDVADKFIRWDKDENDSEWVNA